eukprot:COSAG06_NODE_48047_length_335_cov_0.538136_1_plen_53_part_10
MQCEEEEIIDICIMTIMVMLWGGGGMTRCKILSTRYSTTIATIMNRYTLHITL